MRGKQRFSVARKSCASINRALAPGFRWPYREPLVEIATAPDRLPPSIAPRSTDTPQAAPPTCFDGIHPDIFNVLRILICVSDPVLVVPLLPYFTIEVHLLLCAVRESSLDELHCFLKRY